MNTNKNTSFVKFSAALAATVASSFGATTYQWTSATLGGNWSVAGNWTVVSGSDSTFPAADDVAVLGDVTSGTRTVIYDSSAGGTVGTISFNQSTAGAINELQISRALTVSNVLNLSATAGTARLVVDSGITLTATGGLTVGTNGGLRLSGTATVSGPVTVSGGTVTAVSSPTADTSVFDSTFTMSSGTLSIENDGSAGSSASRSVRFNGDVNITGGAISMTNTGKASTISLYGATNVFSPGSYATGLTLYLFRNGDQSFTTNQTFPGSGSTTGGLVLRGTGVKTVTSTAAGNVINNIALIDGSTNSSVGTTLKLGSNLTLGSGSVMPALTNFSNQLDGSGSVQVGIDTAGHTLDLTAGAGSGKWTVTRSNASGSTQSGLNTAQWTLSNSGTAGAGGIRANAFDFNSTGVTVNVGAGAVLTAAGGNGTSSHLGSSGTFASTAKFVYAGNATSANAATLSSGRTIGVLRVDSGYLRTTGSAFTAAGGIVVNAGAKLNIATAAVSAPTITLGLDGANAGQIVAGVYTYSGDLSLDFASSAVAGTYTLFDLSGAATGGLSSVSLTGLYGLALSGASGVWTGTTGGYDFTFTEATGSLAIVASAIPEPSAFAALAGIFAMGIAGASRLKRRA